MNVLRYLDSLWSEAHTFYGLHIPLAVIRNIKDSSQILLSVNGVFDENSIWYNSSYSNYLSLKMYCSRNAFCGLLVKITSALLTMTQSDRVQYSEITQSFLDLCFILCRNCSAEDTELWVKMRHLFGSAMDRGIDDIFLKSWSVSLTLIPLLFQLKPLKAIYRLSINQFLSMLYRSVT